MIHVIKSRTNLVGCYNNKSYVIGFRSLEHARLVQKHISKHSQIDIIHQRKSDVGQIVNINLKEHFGITSSAFKTIEIDEVARLVIEKAARQDDDLVIQDVTFQDFIMLPFYNHLGIILPLELIREYPDRFEFISQTIDPVSDYKLFKIGGK